MPQLLLAPLLALVTFIIVGLIVGAVLFLDWLDGQRLPRPEPAPQPRAVDPPPFIWSEDQCRKCGFRKDLLSLEDRICQGCHELTHGFPRLSQL